MVNKKALASIFGTVERGKIHRLLLMKLNLVGTSDEYQSLSGLFAETNPESIGECRELDH